MCVCVWGGGHVAQSWESPRLWVTATAVPPAARVDGFYECFMWPPAVATFPLVGPFIGCSARGVDGRVVRVCAGE